MKPFNQKLVIIAKLFAPLWILWNIFLKKQSPVQPPRSILVIDFHLIGDIVMLTPLLRSLRNAYPEAKLVLVAGMWANEVLKGTNLVDEIIPFSAPWVKYGQGLRGLVCCWKLIKQLRKQTWDLGIEVRGDIRQIVLLLLFGSRRRVGFNFTGGGVLLTDTVFDDGGKVHLIEHHQRICEHLGIWGENTKYLPFLKLTSDEQVRAQNINPFIGFHFGASLPLRRFPPSEIISLLATFQFSDCKLLVFLSPGETGFKMILDELPAQLQSKIEVVSVGLRELIVILSRAIHFYCMDSGPAHIASALGVPVTVFFGPAIPANVQPIGNNIEIISLPDVKCRPCNQVNCVNSINQYCMIGLVSRVRRGYSKQ